MKKFRTNVSLLLHYLFKDEENFTDLAAALGITETCLYAKMLYVGFESEEVEAITLRYNIPREEINALFFADFNKESEVN